MIRSLRTYLVLGIALIMVASAFAVVLPGYYGSQQNSTVNGAVQQNFVKALSTGSNVSMSTENYSAVQNQLSKYTLTPMLDNQSISFLVNFKLSNATELSSYITQTQNSFSPYYRHYLVAKDFAPGSKYGPSMNAYNDVINYYATMGFSVAQQYSLGIQFSGNVGQVNKAFMTKMATFELNGSQKFTNSGPLSVPTAFASSISSIDGLNNLLVYKSDNMIAPGQQVAPQSGYAITSNALTSYLSQSQVLQYNRHSFAWADVPGYGLTQFMFPTTMPELYNATDLINNGYNGTGVTIAVVMGQGYNPSDLATFAKEVYGPGHAGQILNRITNMPVNKAATPSNSSWLSSSNGLAGEFTLDIEYSSTMAPAAHIDAVYGPDLSTMSLDSVYLKIASLTNVPQIVTNSWGGQEYLWWNLYGPGYQNANTMNSLFEVLTSEGSTVFFSTGDSAGVGYYGQMLSGAFASTSPYVVGVGGVRTVATSSQGEFPTGNVSNFTLAPYSSQAANGGFWYPNYPLYVANATGIASQSYWYTPSSGSIPFAGGTVGLSYWFNQSDYQHGAMVPNIGRQNSVAISGEADFNETEYFAGMWVFFWGGTSFACPTVAGEFADIYSYLNQQTSSGSYYGNANYLIYQLGNFQDKFQLSPFYSIDNGSNPWAAANQNMGWPNDMLYPAGWTNEHSGYTLLTGWGTVNAYNFAVDAVAFNGYATALSNSSLGYLVSGFGRTTMTLNSSVNYTFTAVDNYGSTLAPNEYVNFTAYYGSGNGTVAMYDNTTSNATGNLTFNTTGLAGDTVYISMYDPATGNVSYWYAFITPVLTTGTLNVTVLQSSVMGGMSWYDGYGVFYNDYPGLAPLMPNTVEVEVTLNNAPVANAYVYAVQKSWTSFQGDYFYGAPISNETSSPFRSVGFTNASGIAFVETWNVADNSTYYVNATYQGLMNSSTLKVTPQYAAIPPVLSSSTNPNLISSVLFFYPEDMIQLPMASPGTSYTVQLQIWDTNLSSPEQAMVSVGGYMSYPGSVLENMIAPVMTSPTGLFNLTINDNFGNGVYFLNVTNPNQQFRTYDGFPMNTPSTYIPIFIGTEGAPPYGYASTGGSFMPVSPDGSISSPYAGQGWTMSGNIFAQYDFPLFPLLIGAYLLPWDNITVATDSGPTYWFDNMAKQTYAVGTDLPQSDLYMNIPIPNLPLGLNTFTVQFNDTLLNITYTYTEDFWIISNSSSTLPTSTIGIVNAQSPSLVQSGTTYYTGNVVFNLSNNQSGYTTSSLEIANSAATVNLVYDVTGLSSFAYNFSALAAGEYTVTYNVMNPNYQFSTSVIQLNVQQAYTLTFNEAGLPSGTTWSVTFGGNTVTSTTSTISFSNVLPGSYDYIIGSVTGFSSPGSGSVSVNGASSVGVSFTPTTFNVTFKETGLKSGTAWTVIFGGTTYNSTTSTITLSAVSIGTYSYTVGNVSGYTSPGSGSLNVAGNSNVNVAFASTSAVSTAALMYIIGGTIGGLVVGAVVMYALARRTKPKAP